MKISKAYCCQRCKGVICHLYKICVIILYFKFVIFNESVVVYVINFIRIWAIQNFFKLFTFYSVDYDKNNILEWCKEYCNVHQSYYKFENFNIWVYVNQLGNIVIVKISSFG
jgi:hypothetical protein